MVFVKEKLFQRVFLVLRLMPSSVDVLEASTHSLMWNKYKAAV